MLSLVWKATLISTGSSLKDQPVFFLFLYLLRLPRQPYVSVSSVIPGAPVFLIQILFFNFIKMCFLFRFILVAGFAWMLFFSTLLKAGEKSEAALIGKLFRSIQFNEPEVFVSIFPSSDSVLHWLEKSSESDTDAVRRPELLPPDTAVWLSDTFIRKRALENLEDFLKNSRELKIRMNETVFVRYELVRFSRPEGLFNGALKDSKYVGYLFFKNPLNRKSYGFSVRDIFFINGQWYGGLTGKIFEADNKEAYERAFLADRKRQRLIAAGKLTDTARKNKEAEEDEKNESSATLREVADRKFYKGRFDNEIAVQLYVRYLKGGCPEGICSWEALFKFGDEDEYIKMEVSKTTDGRWIFAENLGSMELILKDETYTGDYESSNDNTGYKVRFSEVPLSEKKAQKLDYLLQHGLYGE